ncbi:amidohydrolase [Brevibacterium oceani]|uniref:amidohydrolase n=1 Tax=Brevibacterium oceani TaxID=358099 RepID=UPI0015E7E4FC|nr:amidohydrolase [Brevibacterium oceani]
MTTVFTNGAVFTGSAHAPVSEAMAIRDGRVLSVGSREAVRSTVDDSAAEVDVNGALIAPGFVEAHTHMVMLGQTLDKVQLRDCRSLEEIQERLRLRREEQPDAAFILGAGWMFEAIPGGRPTASMIDAVIADIPVLLDSNDVHSAWVNTVAMNAMGIGAETPNPPGGQIVRDTVGDATGLLLESAAIEYAWSYLEAIATDDDRDRFLDSAFRVYLENGVTAATDMAIGEAEAAAFRRRLDRDGHLPFPVAGYWLLRPTGDSARDLESVARAAEMRDQFAAGPGSDWFRIVGVKFILDGVIDACTAAMREPYVDGSQAEPIWSFESAAPVATAADARELELAMHAIGDHASEIALRLVEECGRINGPRPRATRIEHLESVTDSTIARMAALGVTASIQPVHCDPAIMANWMGVLGDERGETGFPWRLMRESGVRMALGTDAPTAPHITSHNLFIALTTRSALAPGDESYHPERAFSPGQALEALTLGAASAGRFEDGIGRIVPGGRANFTVIDVNPFSDDYQKLLDAHTLSTFVDGEPVFANEDAVSE